jgi:hypothetical protein
LTFDNRNAIIWTKEIAMNLKEKRLKALRDYIQLLYTLEDYLFSKKDIVLNSPSLKGEPNNFELTSFELIYTSIYAVQDQYKRTYAILKEFLNKAIEFNRIYGLNDPAVNESIQAKIAQVDNNVIKLNQVPTIAPIMEMTSDNLRTVINDYDYYMDGVSDVFMSLIDKIDINQYDYRLYFKDDFYKYVSKLRFLMDFTSGNGYNLVSMRNCSIINALNDDTWVEDISQHYPKQK